MIPEFNIDGVFLSSIVISALLAMAGTQITRWLLATTGAYRMIWHPALFDASVFVIFWATAVSLPFPIHT